MKTAISLPDDLFAEAERLARETKKSRSQIVREALTEYLVRHDVEGMTELVNRVCRDVDTRLDPLLDAAGRKVLVESEW